MGRRFLLPRGRSSISASIPGSTHRSPHRSAACRCCEALEARTLLTVIYDPVFGNETISQNDDEHLANSPVFMVFWGSFWNDHPDQVDAVRQAAAKVVTSEYPQVINEYGGDGRGMSIGTTVVKDAQASDIDPGNIDDVINDFIDDGTFPESDDAPFDGGPHEPIYALITEPGSGFPGAVGFNTNGSDFDPPFDFDDIPEIWCSTAAKADGVTIDLDNFTPTFSHEVVEVMSDPDFEGTEVDPGFQWPSDSDNEHQICDYEAENYDYRLSTQGVLVESAWSQLNHAFVVNDGTKQSVQLIPHWTGDKFNHTFSLIVGGDQHAFGTSNDDAVTLFTGTDGGTQIVLDGEFYRFDAGKLTDISLHLGAGFNTVDLSGLNTAIPVNMDATGGQIDLRGANISTTWDITGPDAGTMAFNLFQSGTLSDVNSIVGGPKGDRFVFHDGGSLSGDIDGNGAVTGTSNVLDFSPRTTPVGVNLITRKATALGGTFNNIRIVTGGSTGSDTLIASDAHWGIFGPDQGAVSNTGYSSFENLLGGGGDDSFEFSGTGRVSGAVDGGAGTNTLDYSGVAGPVTVNFKTFTASLVGTTFSNIQNVVGSQSNADTVIGPDALWLITGPDRGSVNGFTFSSVENLQGNIQADTFTFLDGGSISGNLDGGAGDNTLDYSHRTTPVTIDFAHHTATGIGGTFGNINGFVGGAGGTNLVGPDAPTTWTVVGPDAVNAFGFTLANVTSLQGGSAEDTFILQSGGSLSGKIDGGGGTNGLIYANSFPGDVVVNLRTRGATALGGVSNVRDVTAGGGNCMLVGDDGANHLTAGAGRAVLIGSGGGDTLAGGDQDTILVADRTAYDANAAALAAIFAEWRRTDAAFEKRVSDLLSTGGGGLNGDYVLNKTTVFADGATDVLVRGDGETWDVLTAKQDTLDDKEPGDRVTQV